MIAYYPHMPTLANQFYEAFALRRAHAKFNKENVADSVLAVWGNPKDKTRGQLTAYGHATAHKPVVKIRIEELMNQVVKMGGPENLTLSETKSFLARVGMAKPSEACAENPLCEMKMSKNGPYYVFPDKIAAIQLLMKLNGWLADMAVNVQLPSWNTQEERDVTEPLLPDRRFLPAPTVSPEDSGDQSPTSGDSLLAKEGEGVVDGFVDQGVQFD